MYICFLILSCAAEHRAASAAAAAAALPAAGAVTASGAATAPGSRPPRRRGGAAGCVGSRATAQGVEQEPVES